MLTKETEKEVIESMKDLLLHTCSIPSLKYRKQLQLLYKIFLVLIDETESKIC